MYSTQLEVFAEIDGIGAASGIFLTGDLLYIIGDNNGYLNEYNIKTKHLRKIQIFFDKSLNQLENIPKPLKPDFESLCHLNNKLFVLGSGSTPKRNLMIEFDLNTQKIAQKNLTETYTRLKTISNINGDNFNIEGAIFSGNEWLLFNRGNGIESTNGIFKIKGTDLMNTNQMEFKKIKLPNINHIESSFTDATLIKNEIFFISAAEDTKSTYADGDILGSFIGRINLTDLNLTFSSKISNEHKFEGLTLLSKNEQGLSFLLCEDGDNDSLKTIIYKLSIKLD